MKYVGVDVGEKSAFWLHVVAHGRPDTARVPIADSAPNRLVRPSTGFSPYARRSSPAGRGRIPASHGPDEPPARAEKFRNIRRHLEDKSFQREMEQDESSIPSARHHFAHYAARLGADQCDSSEAWANLDVRLLPGDDPKEFLATIRRRSERSNVTVEPLDSDFRLANYFTHRYSFV